MKLSLAAVLFIVIAGCGESTPADDGGNDAPAEPSLGDQYAALVQTRYGDCLRKLGATLDQSGPAQVAFDTRGGGYLVFSVTKLTNGKVVTVPSEEKYVRLLEGVGC